MSIEAISRLMDGAQRHGYAVGYFESWSLDSLQGVIDAAEGTRSPMIIGFNGEFLSQRSIVLPRQDDRGQGQRALRVYFQRMLERAMARAGHHGRIQSGDAGRFRWSAG